MFAATSGSTLPHFSSCSMHINQYVRTTKIIIQLILAAQ